jgi:hypothetical protein
MNIVHGLAAASVVALSLAAAAMLPAVTNAEAGQVETLSAQGERRCCEVDRGRWVTEPKSMWTPAACVALGPPGEFAPQGTSGAGACARSRRTPPVDPVPPPPEDHGDPRDPGGHH